MLPFGSEAELKKELDAKEKRIKELEIEVAAAKKEVKDKEELIKAWKQDYRDLKKELKKAENYSKFYKKLWESGLHIPNIKNYIKNHKVYDPWTDQQYHGFQMTIVDEEYYTYSKNTWTTILERIQEEVKDDVPRWISEISDCDNYADVMSTAVQLAFIKAKKKRQGAFGIVHSTTHAYNFFVDHQNNIWIYEPQDGSLRGLLSDDDPPYNTRKLLFIG
jgi:hydrogenase maturation factor